MPNEDSHAQSVIVELQAKLRASQAIYASLQAALSHESPPLAATDKDADNLEQKMQHGDLDRIAAVSDANLEKRYAHELVKLKQNVIDA
jgi:hypothetical protein